MKEYHAQGSIEYLLIIGAVILVAAIVIALLVGMPFGQPSQAMDYASNALSGLGNSVIENPDSLANGIRITFGAVDSSGQGVLTLQNNEPEDLSVSGVSTLTSGSVVGTNNVYENIPLSSGGQATLSLTSLNTGDSGCDCTSASGTVNCTFGIVLQDSEGNPIVRQIPFTVDCVENVGTVNGGTTIPVDPVVLDNPDSSLSIEPPVVISTSSPVWVNLVNYTVDGSSGSISSSNVHSVIDSVGNIYSMGTYQGDMSVGGITLPHSISATIFVAKYNSSGSVLWLKGADVVNGVSGGYPSSIVVGGEDSVLISGSYSGSFSFGGSSLQTQTSSSYFVMKLDSSGNVVYLRGSLSVQPSGSIGVNSVATDSSGNTYNVGQFSMYADLGNGNIWHGAQWSSGVFVAKYNPDGSLAWAGGDTNPGGNTVNEANSVAVNNRGNVYVVGDYRSSLNLGNGFVLAYNGSAPGQGGSPNFFIAKYSPSGTVLWAKRGETTSGMAQTYANSVAVDESGNVYFAGSYSGNMLLGGTLLTKDSGWDRFYVAKLDSSGNLVWVKTSDPYLGNNGYGPVSISYAESVTVDKTGNVYTAGYYEGPLSIGGNPLLTKPNNTNYTFFAVKYNSTGEVIWVKSDTGSLGRGYDNSSMSNSISVDNIGNVYVSGQYFGDLNINGTVMPTQERFWNWSPFLTKFGTN